MRGFVPERAQQTIREDFGSIDALIAQLAIAHDLALLTTDQDLVNAARHIPLRVWGA